MEQAWQPCDGCQYNIYVQERLVKLMDGDYSSVMLTRTTLCRPSRLFQTPCFYVITLFLVTFVGCSLLDCISWKSFLLVKVSCTHFMLV